MILLNEYSFNTLETNPKRSLPTPRGEGCVMPDDRFDSGAQRVAYRRQRILDAAAEVIGRRGFARTSVRDIAARAGVADGTIYNYFRDKDDLLSGLLDRLAHAEQRKMDFGADPPTSFAEYLAKFVTHRFDTLWDNRELVRSLLPELLVNDALRERYAREVLRPSQATGERLFQGIADAGYLAEGEAEITVRAVSSMLLGFLVLHLLGDERVEKRREDLPGALTELLLGGLAG